MKLLKRQKGDSCVTRCLVCSDCSCTTYCQAQQWLDQNYPINDVCNNTNDPENLGKRREEIVSLNISGLNIDSRILMGDLYLKGFGKLKKLDCSFNYGLTNVKWDMNNTLEEYECSHNSINRTSIISETKLKKINLSFNKINTSYFDVPNLIYLDISNNNLTTLNLWSEKNLEFLNCSNNPINNLTLNNSPNLISFDCFGPKLAIFYPTSTALATTTIYANDPVLVGSTIGFGVFSGLNVLVWLALVFIFCCKRGMIAWY